MTRFASKTNPFRDVLPALMALIVPTALHAQPACLDFEEALTISAERDPGVETSRAERDIALADLTEARSLYRPQVAAFGRTGVGDVGLVDSVVQNQVGVRASQRIIDFGDAKFARREARSNVAAGEETIRSRRMSASLNTGLSYINALDADARLEATKERAAYFSRQLEALEAVLPSGGATRSEVAEVAAELAEAQAFALELQFRKEEAVTELRVDTFAAAQTCEINGVETSVNAMFEDIGTLDEAVQAAMSSNPELRALSRRADAFEAARKRENRARLPIISVVGVAAYSSTGSSDDFGLQERVGIDVSIPLYSGNALSARSRRSAARGAAANGEASRVRRQLEEDVSILYRRILSMQAQLIRRGQVKAQLEKQFEAAVIEYESRARTLPELVEVRLRYESAMLAQVALRHDLIRRKLEILTLTSRLGGA